MALYIEQVAERDSYYCDICFKDIPKDTTVDNLDLGFETIGNYDIKHRDCKEKE
tara:strand:+ start:168 stop:329 length:162 start_codon:yes stop_codon:yes gene_type:complete